MRQDLEAALRNGRAVTARIRWLNTANPSADGEGKTRYIHCTPLIHFSGKVGVIMVVLVPPNPNDDVMSVYSNSRGRVGSRMGSSGVLPGGA